MKVARFMVTAMCGVQLKDRKTFKDFIQMLSSRSVGCDKQCGFV